jgi:hypothetical protein
MKACCPRVSWQLALKLSCTQVSLTTPAATAAGLIKDSGIVPLNVGIAGAFTKYRSPITMAKTASKPSFGAFTRKRAYRR